MVLGPAYGDGFAGVSTPRGHLYVVGDEYTEGSLRLVPDVLDENVEMQRLTDGVWNDTGIQIAASTVHLGRDLQVSGAGEWIKTHEISGGYTALIPHSPFDDDVGTDPPHAPIVGEKAIRAFQQSDDAYEVIGTDISSILHNTTTTLRSRLYLKTGSVGATKPMTIMMHRGPAHEDLIFWMRTFPASLMSTPNTEFQIDLLGHLQGETNEEIGLHIMSAAPISVKANSSGVFYNAADLSPFGDEELIQDNLLLTDDAGIIFTNNGDFVTADYVF